MKHLSLLSLFLFCIHPLFAQQYDYQNILLNAHWDDTTHTDMGWAGNRYTGCWAWHNPIDGKEYAIVGAAHGTYFVEVTNPSNPQLRDFVPGLRTGCTWREYKTYQNFVYMVSDDSSPNGLQIADLSYQPDSVHIVHSGNSIFTRSHTIWIDADKLYCGSVKGGIFGTTPESMAVFSLSNPAAPTLLAKLSDDYPQIGHVHDMFVRNDTVYASCGYNQGLQIYKFNSSNNSLSLIQNLTSYPDQGYNHSSTLTDNGDYLVFMDEVPDALAIKVLDVSNMNNLTVVSTFKNTPGATPHNPFMMGNDLVYVAYYQDGVVAIDISNPAQPVRIGYFDTHWQSNNPNVMSGYVGCWGLYPWLPSGVIVAVDMQNGLYLLDPQLPLGLIDLNSNESISIFPNPASTLVNINISSLKEVESIHLFSIDGKLIYSNYPKTQSGNFIQLPINELSKGMYLIRVKSKSGMYQQKLIIQN